ncbi:MAG: transglycosylase SLT domain-containing protein [Heliobacteriaceae bacterium]|nr:transglycosylase SLT domain-containing protein [Heliobacteriaceae bacterium]
MRKVLLLTFTLVCLLFTQGQSQANDVKTVKAAIVKHALELGVDPALALSIARMESGFRYDAKSSHGAVGVFQLMPSTAKVMGLNPYYLNDNIKGGLMYYQKLYKMFGSMELALAAYNAGPTYVQKYKAVPPCSKTFVSRIIADYNNLKKNPDPAILDARKHSKAPAKPQVTEVKIDEIIPMAEPTETI